MWFQGRSHQDLFHAQIVDLLEALLISDSFVIQLWVLLGATIWMPLMGVDILIQSPVP